MTLTEQKLVGPPRWAPLPPTLGHMWPRPQLKSHEGLVWWYVDPWCPPGEVYQVVANVGRWCASGGPIVCMLGSVQGYGALMAGNLARAYRPEGLA